MDFRLTDEQSALRDGARQLLSAECKPELVRQRYDDISATPRELAALLQAQDWLGLLAPEPDGGLGLGVVELCLVLEEAGRAEGDRAEVQHAVLGHVDEEAVGAATELRV